jgi:crossover junction endodeoxyribonuclease RuvC
MKSLSGMQRVAGFDPGLNVTGYGVVECHGASVRLIEAGTVRSKGETLEDRLQAIHNGVRDVIEAFKPSAMAIEQVFAHARFPKAAILLAHARGVICLAGAQAGLGVHHYLPNRVKRAVAMPPRNRSRRRCSGNSAWLRSPSRPTPPTPLPWP